MATPPDFTVGQVLTAAQMNAVGLWRTASGTSSGTATVDITGCFTDDFENYLVQVSRVQVSAVSRQIRFRFMTGASANSVANYNFAFVGWNTAGAAVNGQGLNQTFGNLGMFIDTTTNLSLASMWLYVYAPKLTERTHCFGQAQGFASPNSFWRSGGAEFYGTTQFDGIQLLLDGAGNISCTYAVYGFNS